MYLKYMQKKFDNENYNCYTFVKDFYKNELNIDISNLYCKGDDKAEVLHELYKKECNNWVELEKPEKYCVIAFTNYGKAVDHVGIYLGKGRVIHNTVHTGVTIIEIKRSEWSDKIVGYYARK